MTGNNFQNKKRFLIFLTAIFTGLFLFSVSLLSYRLAYANKIMKNVYYQGNDLSGKSKSQAIALIKNKVQTQIDEKIAITSDTGKTYETTFTETGIIPDYLTVVNQAFAIGRNSNFLRSLVELPLTFWQEKNLDLTIAFDPEKYGTFLQKISEELNVSAIDASLLIKNGEIVALSPTNGQKIDSEGLQSELSEKFLTLTKKVEIKLPTSSILPELDSNDLSSAKTQAERYLNHQMQISLNNNLYLLERKSIGGFVVFLLQNGVYSASLDKTAIKKYVNTLAAKNDTSTIDIKISAIDNSVLQQGRQGIYTDQDDAVNKIANALSSENQSSAISLVQTTKDPQTIKVFPDEGIVPGRFPGKYIDVDLTNQLLTIFEGINQMGQYQVSTGKASKPTPTGTRTIQDKSPRAWSAPYGLYMPWWNGMGGGYGIHELPEWPNGYKEGESHLGTPVSHGCIRLGVGPAQTVYNWADIGTPVYIHK